MIKFKLCLVTFLFAWGIETEAGSCSDKIRELVYGKKISQELVLINVLRNRHDLWEDFEQAYLVDPHFGLALLISSGLLPLEDLQIYHDRHLRFPFVLKKGANRRAVHRLLIFLERDRSKKPSWKQKLAAWFNPFFAAQMRNEHQQNRQGLQNQLTQLLIELERPDAIPKFSFDQKHPRISTSLFFLRWGISRSFSIFGAVGGISLLIFVRNTAPQIQLENSWKHALEEKLNEQDERNKNMQEAMERLFGN